MLVDHLCLSLWDPMYYILPGFSVHGILQARILNWVAIPFSRGSSLPRDWSWVSFIAGRFFNIWAIREGLLSGRTSTSLFQNFHYRLFRAYKFTTETRLLYHWVVGMELLRKEYLVQVKFLTRLSGNMGHEDFTVEFILIQQVHCITYYVPGKWYNNK